MSLKDSPNNITTQKKRARSNQLSSAYNEETLDLLTEFQKLERYLRGIALKLTKDAVNADDLYQETRIKARKFQHTFEKGTNFRAWVSKIMYNNFMNMCRINKKNNVVDLTDVANFIDKPSRSTESGESNINKEDIFQMIDQLPDKYRIPILLHREGYQYEEIRAALELPLGTAKSRIFIGREMLIKLLNSRGYSIKKKKIGLG